MAPSSKFGFYAIRDDIEPDCLFDFCAGNIVSVVALTDIKHTVLEGLLRLRFKQQRIDTHGRTVRQGLERAGLLVNHSFARQRLTDIVILPAGRKTVKTVFQFMCWLQRYTAQHGSFT